MNNAPPPPGKRIRPGAFLKGIQSRILLLLVAVLLPLFLLQAYSMYDRFQGAKARELQINLEMARAVGLAFSAFVTDVVNQELTIGIAATVSPPLSPGNLNRLLQESAQAWDAVRDFHWVGPDGQVQLSSLPGAVSLDLSDRACIQEIRGGRDWVVSDLILSKLTGKSMFAIVRGLRAPGGELLGMVMAVVEPEKLGSVLGIQRRAGAGISLVDRQGRLVYRFPALELSWEERLWGEKYSFVAKALRGQEATTIIPQSRGDGQPRIVSAVSIPSLGWVAGAGINERVVLRPATRALIWNGGLFLLAVLGSGLLGLLVSRTFKRPLAEIIRQLPHIGRGERQDLTAVGGPTQIKNIVTAFNDMLAQQRRTTAILQTVAEATPIAIYVKDTEGRLQFVNRAGLADFGKSAAEVLGRTEAEWLQNPEEAAATRARDREVMEAGASQVFEDQLTTPRGVRTFLSTKSPLTDATGKVVGLVEISRDITERKQAEEELRAAFDEAANEKNRLGAVLAALPVGVAILDHLGGNLQYNKMLSEVWGEPLPSIRGGGDFSNLKAWWLETGAPVQPEEWASAQAVLHGKTVLGQMLEIERFDQEHRYILNSAAPIRSISGEITGCAVTAVDVTALKQAEEALQVSENRLRLAQKAAKIGIFEWNIQTDVNTWTPEAEELHGLPPGGFRKTQAAWEELVYPDDRPEALRLVEQAFATGETTELEYRVVWPDGSIHWLAGRMQVLQDASGRPLSLTGFNIDITERKKMEEELRQYRTELEDRVEKRTAALAAANAALAKENAERQAAAAAVLESKARLQILYNTVQTGVLLQGANGDIVHANHLACEIFGLTQEELIGKTSMHAAWQMVLEDGSQVPGEEHPSMITLRTGQPIRNVIRGLFANDPDKIRWLIINTEPIRNPVTGTLQEVTITFQDITRLKRAEAEIKVSLREKEVLLQEIHHRVKNNLQIVIGMLTLQAQALQDPAAREALKDCQARIQAMSLVHESLYRFGDLAAVNLAEYLQSLGLAIVHSYQTGLGISLRFDLAPLQTSLDTAIPCGLILVELLTNAVKHAFTGRPGGEIFVSLQHSADRQTVLTVRDDGIGLPDADAPETAKSLGLTLVQDLVRLQLEGDMVVDRDHGTAIRIIFTDDHTIHKGL